MYHDIYFWSGISFIGTIFLVGALFSSDKKVDIAMCCMIIAVGNFGIGRTLENMWAMESLTKEVPLEQITMKGKKHFSGKVDILFKDGKLDSVTLVSSSSMPESVRPIRIEPVPTVGK